MELKAFTAPTIAEAYELVRAAMGEDALIISTHTSPRLGGSAQVEVVAGLPVATSAARPALADDFAAHALVRALAEGAAAGSTAASPMIDSSAAADGVDAPDFVNPLAGAWRRPAADPVPSTPDEPAETRDIPVSDEALLATIEGRTRAIESTVRWLASRRANAIVSEGPPALADVHARLMDRGVPERLLIPLVQRLEGQLRQDASTREVLRVAERTLAGLLPPPPQFDPDRAGLVIFVVGPSGSGKTSVALRLAREVTARRAVIAGTDVDRAGVPQQLLASAAAVGVDARLCYAPSELRALLREEPGSVVIVDTPGHVGARQRMLELNAYAQIAPRRAVLLTLPATIGAADALRAASAFARLEPLGVVATRMDEGAAFGGVVSALLESGRGLAYTTASEDTSSGLSVGDNHALALAVLTGLWPARRPAAPPTATPSTTARGAAGARA